MNTDCILRIVEKAAEELVLGLHTDLTHHKQHHMEQALRLLVGDELVDEERDKGTWKEGIEP